MAESLHYILHKEMKTLLNDIMPSVSLTDNLLAICNTYFQRKQEAILGFQKAIQQIEKQTATKAVSLLISGNLQCKRRGNSLLKLQMKKKKKKLIIFNGKRNTAKNKVTLSVVIQYYKLFVMNL